MGYVLGVDLGTTFTAAAVLRDGVVRVATLGVRASEVPSVAFLREDGEVLIGEAAERRSGTEPGRVAREFKRRMGDPIPILLGGSPFSAHGLTARLLRAVVDQVAASEGGPPDRIVVTRPANWGEYKRELLTQALHLAEVEATTAPEPEAAAVHYASAGRVAADGVVAVYDLGGGTFDATVVRNTGGRFEQLGTPLGIEQLGGVDFDDAVFAFVVDALGDAGTRLDADDPVTLSALGRLRRDCVDAKEALSSDTEVTIAVALPAVQTELRLTRTQFEDMIRPSLVDTISMLRRALRSAEVDPTGLDAVLLVGGSSRIPLVGDLLTQELHAPIAVDVHPKHAVALGATLLAEHATASGDGGTITTDPALLLAPPLASRAPAPAAPTTTAEPTVPPTDAPTQVVRPERAPQPIRSDDRPTAPAPRPEPEPAMSPAPPPAARPEPPQVPPPLGATPLPLLPDVPANGPRRSSTPLKLLVVAILGSVAIFSFLVVTRARTDRPDAPLQFAPDSTIRTRPRPTDLEIIGDDLWVVSYEDGFLQRFDVSSTNAPLRDEVNLQFNSGSSGADIVVDGRTLYVTQFAAHTVAVVDADQGVLLERISIDQDGRPLNGAILDDSLWVTVHPAAGTEEPGRIVQVVDHEVIDSFDMELVPSGINALDGELWVTFDSEDKIGRFDPVNDRTELIAVGAEPTDLLLVGDDVWVTLRGDDRLAVVDRSSLEVSYIEGVGPQPYKMALGMGVVWVTNAGRGDRRGSASTLDPGTRTVIQEAIDVGQTPIGLAVDSDRTYVGDSGGRDITVIVPR